jgi:hypothetical protein
VNKKVVWLAMPIIALLPSPRLAHAYSQYQPCLPGAHVMYINGILAPNEAKVAFEAFQLSLEINHFNVTCVADVGYLYNPSDGLINDLVKETATQKATDLAINISDAFYNTWLTMFGQASLFSKADQSQILDKIDALIQSITLSTSFTISGTTFTTAGLVSQFRDRVLTDLGQGTKTILVAHSQGNFFANETYLAVLASATPSVSQGLTVVNVADPSLNTPSGLWVTANQDLVIEALGPLAPPANFDATGAYACPAGSGRGCDWMGHGFTGIYLNRTLPSGTTEADSIDAHVMDLIGQALSLAKTPVVSILGCTSSSLFSLNLATNVATILGSFTYTDGSLVPVWDIAVNPHGGLIYAISSNAVSVFDASTRSLLRLPSSNIGGNALGFNADGELYSMGGNNIYRIDTTSGEATPLPISLGTYSSSGDLTFDSDGDMFGTVVGPGSDYLVRVDVNRSTLTVVGPIGYSAVYGLYFSAGSLYGVTNGGTIITIDRATGTGMTVGSLPIGDITGLQ